MKVPFVNLLDILDIVQRLSKMSKTGGFEKPQQNLRVLDHPKLAQSLL